MESQALDETVVLNTENNYKHHQESKLHGLNFGFVSRSPMSQRIWQVCGTREHLAANL